MSQHHVRAFDQEETKSSCRRRSAGGPVQNLVAFSTKRDQVGLCVVTKGTAPSYVVNIEILGASTLLTAPTITLQDLRAPLRIRLGAFSDPRPFLLKHAISSNSVQADGSSHVRRSAAFESDELAISDSRFCKSAPARKSAQTISRR